MSDIYFTLINRTRETLYKEYEVPIHGDFITIPDTIPPLTTVVIFIKARVGALYGAQCKFKYIVRTAAHTPSITFIEVSAACPYSHVLYSNEAEINQPLPKSVYNNTYRATVNGTDWTFGMVPLDGYPLRVEGTFKYEDERKYRFRLVNITAKTDHPVRNSRKKLIRPSKGPRIIWNSQDSHALDDSSKGSFEPNVFAHDFGKHVDSSFVVTFQAIDLELIGAECFLYGIIGTERVFQSEFVEIDKINTDISVTVHVAEPTSSSHPFVWNADVQWGMELKRSTWVAECLKPDTSRLEFYWVAKTIHDAFQNGIPVNFLRNVMDDDAPSTATSKDIITEEEWKEKKTKKVFGKYNKIYDTISGAPAFGVLSWGGIFNEAYYLAPNETGLRGTLYNRVNCMDQAAMLQLILSFGPGPRPSWLVQKPFGFLKTTHLVGVVDENNQLVNINNPFFGTDRTLAFLDDWNDSRRTSFGMHVYNGYSKPFNADTTLIYDACGGPHTGSDTSTPYLTTAIDKNTTLYATANPPMTYGTPMNIVDGAGVTGIDGAYIEYPAPSVRIPEAFRKPVTKLLALSAIDHPIGPTSHRNWAHVPDWIKHVLDDQWGVPFGQVSAGHSTSNAFWHLNHAEENELHLRLNVHTETQTGDEEALDITRSASAARDRLESILMSTDRNPEDLWVRGTLDEFGEYSLQYAEHIPAGRIIIVSGNVLMDISGASSSAALETYARQLLEHTVVRDHPPLRMAAVRCPFLETSEYTHGRAGSTGSSTSRTVVNGVGTEFYVRFELDSSVVAASAHVEGAGILVDDYVLEEVSENHSAVIFTFVSQELGSHNVNVHFADSLTLISTTKKVEVVVVDNEHDGGV